MAPTWLFLAALCAFCAASWAITLTRPDLAAYQDVKECTFRGSTWYVLYRNMKQGAFGEDDRCMRETQTSDLVNGKGRFRVRLGNGHEWNATVTFKSKDGLNYNAFEAHVDDDASLVGKYNLLFVDCKYCKIAGSATGSKCLMSVRPSALRHGVPRHCNFIYDLLCGTSPRYQVSDSSCLDDVES